MTGRPIRESEVQRGHLNISVVEYPSGKVLMTVVDTRCMIIEEIALKHFIEANQIQYSDQEGWMHQGTEIPYLD